MRRMQPGTLRRRVRGGQVPRPPHPSPRHILAWVLFEWYVWGPTLALWCLRQTSKSVYFWSSALGSLLLMRVLAPSHNLALMAAIELASWPAYVPLLFVYLLINLETRKAAVYWNCFSLQHPQRDLSMKLGHVVTGEQAPLNLIHRELRLASWLCSFPSAA